MIVEAEDVVEAFHDDEAVLGDELAVAGFLQAAGLLAEEFEAAMEAFWEPMLGGWFFSGAFGSGELLVFPSFCSNCTSRPAHARTLPRSESTG